MTAISLFLHWEILSELSDWLSYNSSRMRKKAKKGERKVSFSTIPFIQVFNGSIVISDAADHENAQVPVYPMKLGNLDEFAKPSRVGRETLLESASPGAYQQLPFGVLLVIIILY